MRGGYVNVRWACSCAGELGYVLRWFVYQTIVVTIAHGQGTTIQYPLKAIVVDSATGHIYTTRSTVVWYSTLLYGLRSMTLKNAMI